MTDTADKKDQSPTLKDERQFRGPDTEMMLASQRRNVEAMIHMSRATFDAAQQAWRIQLDFLEQAAGRLTDLVSMFGHSNALSDQQLATRAEYSKLACEKNLAKARELAELLTKTTNEAMGVISLRFCDGLGEMRRAWKLNGETR